MQTSARDFLLSFGLIALLVLVTPERYLTPLFIIFGQGHFLLMYLYQYRAGKITARYIRFYILIAAPLLAFMLLYQTAYMREIFLLVSAVVFGLHFFFDELFVAHLPISRLHTLIGISFGIQYVTVSYVLVFGIPSIALAVSIPLMILSWILTLPLVYSRIRTTEYRLPELLLLGLIVVFTCMVFVPVPVSAVQILAFTVLFHYVRWYLFYASRLNEQATADRFRRYIKDVVVVNAVVICAYLLYTGAHVEVLHIAFSQTYFYFWTILHVLFSLSFFTSQKK